MSASMRNALLVTVGLVLALGVYVLHLHSQISLLKQENDLLQKQKDGLETLLAEREEQKALQRKLDEQLKTFSEQAINRQRDQLQQMREQHQKELAAARDEKDRLLRELQVARMNVPVPVTRTVDSPGAAGPTGYWLGPGLPGQTSVLTNVALGKTITSSAGSPVIGSLAQITDGVNQGPPVTLRRGTQWVQIDLEDNALPLHHVVIWHDYQPQLRQSFHDVIVQASNDPMFKTNVLTIFNNDADNSSALGRGKDKEYVESLGGRQINFPWLSRQRYLRFYSRGSDVQASNAYQEIEVLASLVPADVAKTPVEE